MASRFQIFQLVRDPITDLQERKPTWDPFDTREEAVYRIENVGRHPQSGYEPKDKT